MNSPPATPIEQVRFVVLDSETTGLDPRKDRIVTIGAIAVIGHEIRIDDSFEALLKLDYNSSAVTVHGVTAEESQQGLDEPEAVRQFLDYLGDAVIVGHHIGHDIETFNTACERHCGFRIQNASLDTMELTLHLENDGAFAGQDTIRDFSLDSLCALFNITPHDRHTAPGDAFLTALVFQRLLRLALRYNRPTLDRLLEPLPPRG